MTATPCEFPATLALAPAPAGGNLDRVTFVHGLVRKNARDAQPVPHGFPVVVEGWALAPDGGAGAAEVVVTVGAATAIRARAQLPRPDVATAFRRAELERVGFRATVPTHDLPLGTYHVNFHVVDRAAGLYYSWYEGTTFEVGPPDAGVPRHVRGRMAIEIEAVRAQWPILGERPEEHVVAGMVVAVTGWAVDAELRAPAGDVHVIIDDDVMHRALYGYASDDAARRFGAPALACGFKAGFQTRTLYPGLHSFRIVAVSADGAAYDQTEEQLVEISAAPHAPKLGTVNARRTAARIERVFRLAPDGTALRLDEPVRVARGSVVHASGWAVDEAAAAAGGNAVLLVDDAHVFAAFYGALRDDVAEQFGGAAFRECGFTGAIATSDLVPGVHTLRCLVRTSDDDSWLVGSDVVRFEIT